MRAGSFSFGENCIGRRVFQRTLVAAGQNVTFERVAGTFDSTFTTSISVTGNVVCLLVSHSGVCLARTTAGHRWNALHHGSIVLIGQSQKLLVRVARGEQNWSVITFSLEGLETVRRALQQAMAESEAFQMTGFLANTIDPKFRAVIERLQVAEEDAEFSNELLAFSALAEAAALLSHQTQIGSLAPATLRLPESIAALVEDVRANPQEKWPLKAASDMAGYSPFHFSRLFKQLVGVGFHEFVDRLRTERAVELICSTDESIDGIAIESGFGTTQSLRDSIKEYLGLVPSDLRAEPTVELLG